MDRLTLERSNTLNHAQQIVDRAKADRRELTPTEQSAVEADLARVDELDRSRKDGSLFNRVMGLGSAEDFSNGGPGNLLTAEAKAGFVTAIKTRSSFRTDVDRKSITGASTLVPPAVGQPVAGLYPGNMVALADLFRNEPASAPVVRYYKFTAGSAAVVAEGAPKPDSGSTVTPVDVTLKKLATISKVSDELMQDAGYLVAFLAEELQRAVVSAENAEIVSSLTASGILTDTGTAATIIDMVSEAVAAQESVSGLTPSAVIAHPNTVASIRALKATTESYHVDPWTAGPPSLHGLALASTPAVAANTVYVVASQAVVIYRRGPIQVETGLDGTDFTTNMRTIRCEERMASAVVRPSGIVKITTT